MVLVHCISVKPQSSISSIQDLRTGHRNGYVGKQPVAWEEYCVEYWLKEFQVSMDRCTGHCNITKILLEMSFNTILCTALFLNGIYPPVKFHVRYATDKKMGKTDLWTHAMTV